MKNNLSANFIILFLFIFFKYLVIILLFLNINIVRADFTAKVQRVVDGDTVYVEDEAGKKFKVRLTGIDAPEKKSILWIGINIPFKRTPAQ